MSLIQAPGLFLPTAAPMPFQLGAQHSKEGTVAANNVKNLSGLPPATKTDFENFIYLMQKHRYKELPSVDSLPKCLYSAGRLKRGAGNSMWVSHVGGRNPST